MRERRTRRRKEGRMDELRKGRRTHRRRLRQIGRQNCKIAIDSSHSGIVIILCSPREGIYTLPSITQQAPLPTVGLSAWLSVCHICLYVCLSACLICMYICLVCLPVSVQR